MSGPSAIAEGLDVSRPYGGLDYRVAKGWTGKAYWGYYGYHEDLTALTQDVFAPRNFRIGSDSVLPVRPAA